MMRMAAEAFIHCRVSAATKAALGAVARHQGLTDSALLKRMIDLALQSAHAASGASAVAVGEPVSRAARITVRLRPDDLMLLQERATARGMPSATYLSVLTRAHLRSLAPLPKEELLALKRTVSELGAIGRILNQIARAANQGDRVPGPGRDEIKMMLKVCEGLRDHVKALLSANLRSWERGYGGPDV
jgi:hypothetical protein